MEEDFKLEELVKGLAEMQAKLIKKVNSDMKSDKCDIKTLQLASKILKDNNFFFKPSQKSNKMELIEDMEIIFETLPFKD